MYPAELVKPMREDLTSVGFTELHTTDDVQAAMKKEGTTLVVVNSERVWLYKMQKLQIIYILFLQV